VAAGAGEDAQGEDEEIEQLLREALHDLEAAKEGHLVARRPQQRPDRLRLELADPVQRAAVDELVGDDGERLLRLGQQPPQPRLALEDLDEVHVEGGDVVQRDGVEQEGVRLRLEAHQRVGHEHDAVHRDELAHVREQEPVEAELRRVHEKLERVERAPVPRRPGYI